MYFIKIVGYAILVVLGIFVFIFGGYDDSPGAQGLGVLIVLLAVWRIVVRVRKQ